MNVLIVDDELLARDWLRRLLARMPGVRVGGEAGSGEEAIAKVQSLAPDLVLLDIRIPGRDGLEVARRLGDVPFIFTTAYGQYALEAFELDACDYLVKPIAYEKLAVALERARRRLLLQQLWRQEAPAPEPPPPPEEGKLVVHEGGTMRLVDARHVLRFRALDKYTSFWLNEEEFFIRDSLDSLGERLAPFGFLRVHRAELVRKTAIVSLASEPGARASLRLINGQLVAVSRRYLAPTRRALGLT